MKDLSNENIIHVNKNGIQYIQFRKLLEYKDILSHAFGVGLDRSYRTTSNCEQYDKSINNYKELCNAVGMDYINIVKPMHAHTNNVKKVERKINLDKPDLNLEEYNLSDGLITDKKDIVLSTTSADCILLMLFDPVKKVVGNVHSGWRGTLGRISVQAVRKMEEEYGCKPEDIICCICPSIRKCHFEVEKDVAPLFEEEFKDIDGIIEQKSETKWLIDTIKINKVILESEGLKPENIVDSQICSVCDSDVIHSFRVEKKGYGLCTAVICLK